ncbi:hypothetical protein [Streptomyces sp. 8L]|uniref:hypothetical protein n=1 Tax=Streptomyces sp. 8L TaxID=2877242 RepID=UPI001CD60356|nr:hypothetical protein [Streptomyces sp. 8L]MCA1221193.1 hypothetical protein [Streptomyces sp. 8L]
MGWTVLYIAFGFVALWLLGEVLLQYKARLRWRALAFVGFVTVVIGVVMGQIVLIVLGAIAFGVGQTYVTLSFRKGYEAGWAVGGRPTASRRRRGAARGAQGSEDAAAVEGAPGTETSDAQEAPEERTMVAAPAQDLPQEDGGVTGGNPPGETTVYAPQPLPDDTGQLYGVYDDTAAGTGVFAAEREGGHSEYSPAGYDTYGGYEQPTGHGAYAGYETAYGDQADQAAYAQQQYGHGYGEQGAGTGQDTGSGQDYTGYGTGATGTGSAADGIGDGSAQQPQYQQQDYAQQDYGQQEFQQTGYQQSGYPDSAYPPSTYQPDAYQTSAYQASPYEGTDYPQPDYQQQYAGYDPSSYAPYENSGGQQQYQDPYATDTPPGGVWVPQQRDSAQSRQAAEQPGAYDPSYPYDPSQQHQPEPEAGGGPHRY